MKEEDSKIIKKQDLIFSTRCSDVFRKQIEQDEYLNFQLRYPIDESLFQELELRLNKIRTTVDLEFYKFQKSNPPSLLVKYQDLSPVLGSSWIPVELEDRFISILELVRKLHDQEIILGDIYDTTFVLNEKKQVTLGSILGDYDFAAKQTATMPPQGSLNYLAPERSTSIKANKQTDIYGLGVYAYKLFTNYYPSKNDKASSVRSDVPIWLDSVVSKCLNENPQERFSSVTEIANLIKHTVNTGKLPKEVKENSPVQKTQTKEAQTKSSGSAINQNLTSSEEKIELEEDQKIKETRNKQIAKPQNKIQEKSSKENIRSENKSSFKKIALWAFSILMGLLVASFLFLSIGADKSKDGASKRQSGKKDIAVSNPIALVAEYASEDSRELILKLLKSKKLEEKKELLTEINENDPKVSMDLYSAIISSAKGSESGNVEDKALSNYAKKLITSNLEKMNMNTTAGLLQDWLEYKVSPVNSLILRALEITRPVQSKIDLLKKASKKDEISSLRFAAAMAIDKEEYIKALKQVLKQVSPNESFDDLGLGALLLSHSAFKIFLDKDLPDAVKKFSDQDLYWSLLKSAESNSPFMKNIAQELISRNLLSPKQMIFLGVLIKGDSSTNIYNRELVLGALDKLQSTDLYNLAKWESLDSEKILLAVAANSKDNKIVRESLELLAAKSLQNKVADNFIDWIKDGFWEYRAKLARPVSVISLSEVATEEEINQALDSLMPFAKGGLFNVISSTNDPYLIKNAINRMGELLPSSDLMSLLYNESPEIRIEAVKSLKGRNEIKALQGIVKAYDNEKDQKVISVYNEYHWVTKERSKKGF